MNTYAPVYAPVSTSNFALQFAPSISNAYSGGGGSSYGPPSYQGPAPGPTPSYYEAPQQPGQGPVCQQPPSPCANGLCPPQNGYYLHNGQWYYNGQPLPPGTVPPGYPTGPAPVVPNGPPVMPHAVPVTALPAPDADTLRIEFMALKYGKTVEEMRRHLGLGDAKTSPVAAPAAAPQQEAPPATTESVNPQTDADLVALAMKHYGMGDKTIAQNAKKDSGAAAAKEYCAQTARPQK